MARCLVALTYQVGSLHALLLPAVADKDYFFLLPPAEVVNFLPLRVCQQADVSLQDVDDCLLLGDGEFEEAAAG